MEDIVELMKWATVQQQTFMICKLRINSVSSCGLGGPLTLKIDSGAYMGQVVIPYITGMNSSNTLTY